MSEIKGLLSSEITGKITDLGLSFGNEEEESKKLANLERLHRLRVEEEKIEAEQARIGIEIRKTEEEIQDRKKQAKVDKIFKVIGVVVETVAIGAPLIFYGMWMKKGFEFEKTGTITSGVFRGLTNKFKTTK